MSTLAQNITRNFNIHNKLFLTILVYNINILKSKLLKTTTVTSCGFSYFDKMQFILVRALTPIQ